MEAAQDELVGRVSLRRALLLTYQVYGLAILAATVVAIIQVFTYTSASGLADGIYAVTVQTNVAGEQWIEVTMLVLAVPAILLDIWAVVRSALGY